jgi:hypothetical protein
MTHNTHTHVASQGKAIIQVALAVLLLHHDEHRGWLTRQ